MDDLLYAREAVFAAPENDQAWLVYGDALQTHGDPRGEIIAHECRGNAAQAKRLTEKYEVLALGAAHQPNWHLTWHRGHIQIATLRLRRDRDLLDELTHLLSLSACDFLRTLHLHDASVTPSLERIIARITQADRLLLERLVCIHKYEVEGPVRARIEQIEPLLDAAATPALRSLHLGVRFAETDTEVLTRLVNTALLSQLTELSVHLESRTAVGSFETELAHLESLDIGAPLVRCPACDSPALKDLVRIRESGIPHGMEGHVLVHIWATMFECLQCKRGLIYDLDHDCFQYDEDWNIVNEYSMSAGDLRVIADAAERVCPDLRVVECDCDIHDGLRNAMSQIRLATISQGPFRRHRVTAHLDGDRPVFEPS